MVRWYAVNTLSNFEHKVERSLRQRLANHGVAYALRDVQIPTESHVTMVGDRRVTKDRKIAPNYVLIKCDLPLVYEHVIALRGRQGGVIGFLEDGNENPVPMTDVEVDRFLGRDVSRRQGVVPTGPTYTVGDEVRVVSGPMADFNGVVQEVNEPAQQLTILVQIFGRDTPVQVAYDQVRLDKRSHGRAA